jgi:hypothetical protein
MGALPPRLGHSNRSFSARACPSVPMIGLDKPLQTMSWTIFGCHNAPRSLGCRWFDMNMLRCTIISAKSIFSWPDLTKIMNRLSLID